MSISSLSYGSGTSLFSIVQRWAERSANSSAVEFEADTLSYADLIERAQVRASALRLAGVSEGDRVAWLGPNHPAMLELLLACARIGAIALPLNSRLAVPEHAWILDDAQPKLLIAEAEFFDHAVAAVEHCETDIVCERDIAAATCSGQSIEPTAHIGTPDHAVLLAYTSGTTGHPKGAVLTQAALLANAVNSTHAHDLTRHDRVLTVIPLFHVGGLNIQTMPALLSGASVLLHRGFDPGLFLDDVERWQPTWTVLVPAALAAVSSHPRFADTDLSSLHGIMTGSSPIPPVVTQPYFERGILVGEIYGATETAPICVHLRPDEALDHPGSCGKASTLCEIRLVRVNDAVAANNTKNSTSNPVQTALVPGESGEIWVRGASIMREYWRNPEATNAAIVDGWYRTGDVAHADANGWLYMDDRLTDMIISGGENVYPAEIEEQLAHCPTVADAAVIGRPDSRWGEVPIVIAVPNDDQILGLVAGDSNSSAKAATDAVLDYLRPLLAHFKLPVEIIWTDALPKTALGKVQKAVLRERFHERFTAQ